MSFCISCCLRIACFLSVPRLLQIFEAKFCYPIGLQSDIEKLTKNLEGIRLLFSKILTLPGR